VVVIGAIAGVEGEDGCARKSVVAAGFVAGFGDFSAASALSGAATLLCEDAMQTPNCRNFDSNCKQSRVPLGLETLDRIRFSLFAFSVL
jgi:hypothetical protein